MFPIEAIAVGEALAIDTATTTNGMMQHAKLANSADTDGRSLAFGVALEAAGAASTITPILCQVAGLNTAVRVDGTVAVDERLIAGTVDGELVDTDSILVTGSVSLAEGQQIADSAVLGVALTAAAGTGGSETCTAWLLDPLNLAD